MQKYEDDARAKVATANALYTNQLRITHDMRTAYYTRNLPRFIRVISLCYLIEIVAQGRKRSM